MSWSGGNIRNRSEVSLVRNASSPPCAFERGPYVEAQRAKRRSRTERRGKQVVYIKESEQISDFLNIIGASQMYFRFQDVKITRELVNTANRINNCESANMEKTASAALRQRLDVALIAAERGLDSLPEKLRQAAVLRRDNPELSLAELAELADPPISKSGLNHRFEKLSAMAEAIRAAQ